MQVLLHVCVKVNTKLTDFHVTVESEHQVVDDVLTKLRDNFYCYKQEIYVVIWY